MEFTAAKVFSIVVLLAALLVVIFLPTRYAVDLQLIGGIWILQIFPAVVLGLFSSRLRPRALFAGWLVGMAIGTCLTVESGFRPLYHFAFGNFSLYIGLAALLGNLAVSLAGSYRFEACSTVVPHNQCSANKEYSQLRASGDDAALAALALSILHPEMP